MTLRIETAALGMLFALFAAAGATRAQPGGDCGALANLKIENTNLLSATIVPAGGELPEYCRVLGYVRPAINFEVRMPTRDWNGKFYMAGCGGFCGSLDSDEDGFANSMNYGLKRNYAAATMDSGHWGASAIDGRWAYNNRVAENDWGWRAVTETARVGKALVKTYYGAEQKKAYFAGCSTGGRMANMEARKFPNDFDGIISGAPTLDATGLATFQAWLAQANTGPDGSDIFPKQKVALVRDKVYEACDAKDGLKDGLIDDPRACDFKPASLRCRAGDGPDCLTAEEVGVLEKWYAGARDSRDRQLYPGGVPPGSEPFWPLWLTGFDKGGGRFAPRFVVEFLRYVAFVDDPGESYGVAKFDFDSDPPRLATMAAIYNATDSDLSAFKARGGKLLMYHGWADPIVPPQGTMDYYEAVEKTMGGRGATQGFLRLFMIPGFDHCGWQPGPGITELGFDPLTALENWVEKGEAPASLLATKQDKDGKAVWTRPLCPYPQKAKYKGGDVNVATNFACSN
jgi:feruloyl esterase